MAIESSGHVEPEDLQTLRLDHLRRIYILLTGQEAIDPSQTIQRLALPRVRVDEMAFAFAPEAHPYQTIGRSYAWMPEANIRGRLAIDDVQRVPWRDIFENDRLPAHATIIIGTVSKTSELLLPPRGGITGQIPDHQYYVFGQTLRTTDTIPNKPYD